jgi:hypothetical protein
MIWGQFNPMMKAEKSSEITIFLTNTEKKKNVERTNLSSRKVYGLLGYHYPIHPLVLDILVSFY